MQPGVPIHVCGNRHAHPAHALIIVLGDSVAKSRMYQDTLPVLGAERVGPVSAEQLNDWEVQGWLFERLQTQRVDEQAVLVSGCGCRAGPVEITDLGS